MHDNALCPGTVKSFRYAVLGSGSKSNAYYFEYQGLSLLVDNGYSCREIERRLDAAGFSSRQINFILVTHTHIDHIRGVGTFSAKYSVPVVSPREMIFPEDTARKIHQKLDIEAGKLYQHGVLRFSAFETSHDSPHSVGYYLELGEHSVCIITDTGRITPAMENCAVQADLLFLEANYCPKMLARGPYPYPLKQRIASHFGHLSNEEAVTFINKLYKRSHWSHVYFCHLSENNNSPESLEKAIESDMVHKPSYTICPRNELIMGREILERKNA